MFIPMPGIEFIKRSDVIIQHHNIELSQDQREQRRTFAKLGQDIYDAQQALQVYQVGHQHVLGPRVPYDPEDKWFSTSAVCVICSRWFGWWCPKSDHGLCAYEHGEMCIHCGQPEKRK